MSALFWAILAVGFGVACLIFIKVEREDPYADDEFYGSVSDEAQEWLHQRKETR